MKNFYLGSRVDNVAMLKNKQYSMKCEIRDETPPYRHILIYKKEVSKNFLCQIKWTTKKRWNLQTTIIDDFLTSCNLHLKVMLYFLKNEFIHYNAT